MPLKEYKPGITFPGVIGRTFDQSESSCHDPDVRLWEECSYEEKKLYVRMMEVFAGFPEHTDYHIGRLLQFLKDIPDYEPPFEFTGNIYGVTVDVSGKLIEDKEAETRMVMARR